MLLLGMLATMPWGAVVGASVKSAGAGFGLTFLPMIVLIAISGTFYPIELGGQFHTFATFGVLGAYALLGLLVAPRVLRAMARKESGSAVESRKAHAIQGWS